MISARPDKRTSVGYKMLLAQNCHNGGNVSLYPCRENESPAPTIKLWLADSPIFHGPRSAVNRLQFVVSSIFILEKIKFTSTNPRIGGKGGGGLGGHGILETAAPLPLFSRIITRAALPYTANAV